MTYPAEAAESTRTMRFEWEIHAEFFGFDKIFQ